MYRHTQIGWVILALCSLVVVFILAVPPVKGEPLPIGPALLLTAMPLLVMLLFCGLTVTVDGEWIEVRFGPGLIRRRIPLADVADCTPFRYPWYWGWGIRRMGLRGGLLFNVSGLQAVELRMKDGERFGIGTDEPERLCEAIRGRLKE
jgi:hypothetical protein